MALGISLCAFNSKASELIGKGKSMRIDSTKKTLVDPVCKMKVKAETAKTMVYNKVTYNFCSESCKQKFVTEPAKYIKK